MVQEGREDQTLVVVSPHPDDAAFSVGGLLAERNAGALAVGVTVFTRCQAMHGAPTLTRAVSKPLSLVFSKARADRWRQRVKLWEVTRLRRREDVRFFKSVGARRLDLGLIDAQLRGYGWYPIVKDASGVKDDPITNELISLFRGKMPPYGGETVGQPRLDGTGGDGHRSRRMMLLPLALGGHADHVIVREACSRLDGDQFNLYYEDLPYAEGLSDVEIRRGVDSFDPQLEPHIFNIQSSIDRKIENLKLYKTQVGKEETDRVVRYANRVGGGLGACERLWCRRTPDESWARRFFRSTEVFPMEGR